MSLYSSGNKREMCNVKLYVSAYIRLKNFVKSFGTLLFWNTTVVRALGYPVGAGDMFVCLLEE